jgi:hypothetical protein
MELSCKYAIADAACEIWAKRWARNPLSLITTHQRKFVSIWVILEVFWNISMAEIRRDETRRLRSVEIKGDTQEWRDIWVVEGGPNAHFSDESLMEDKKA